MWKKVSMVIAVAACVALLAPASAMSQGKVDELEKKIQSMEAQLNELKTMLQSQQAAPAEPAAPIAPGKSEMTLIGKGGTLEIGGDIRLRGLFFDNLWDFDGSNDFDQREVFRFRPRVYFDWKPTDDMEAYVRVAKEWFYGQDNERLGYDVEGKDVMFDNAWGQYSDIMGTGLTLRLGRQDLIYGDGFVLLDGTPQDGSMTIAFDAAKLTWAHDWGSSDLIYAKLHENNNQRADDEDLYGLYNKFKFDDYGLGLEPYFLVRNKNDAVDTTGIGPATYPFAAYDPSPKEETFLLGARATYNLDVAEDVNLAFAAEGGKQFGEMDFSNSPLVGVNPASGFSRFGGDDTVDRDAWGGQFHGTLTFKSVPWTPSVKAGVSYMSGDDPNTADYEGWDDFYGQWPKYSELYVYSLYDGFKFLNGGNDVDVGVWSNMIIPELKITMKPTDRWTQTLRALYFLADEKTGPGNGNERGLNLQWLTEYTFTKNLSGHVLFEWMDPGDYYGPDADDALFTRFEVMYKF